MQALTFRGRETIRLESVPEPRIEASTDALVRVRLSSICGSDLHPYHGREKGLDRGTVMGHEFVGEIVETGREARGLSIGDRVLRIALFLGFKRLKVLAIGIQEVFGLFHQALRHRHQRLVFHGRRDGGQLVRRRPGELHQVLHVLLMRFGLFCYFSDLRFFVFHLRETLSVLS